MLHIQGDGNFFPNGTYSTNDSLEEGDLYRSKAHLKWWVHHYHLKKNRTFRVKKSNQSVYTVICTEENCKWRLYAKCREEDNAFVIIKNPWPHTCVLEEDRPMHPHLTCSFIASLIRSNVKTNVEFKIKDIMTTVEERYDFKIPYFKAWRAKDIAINQLFGGWRESYNLILPLLNAISRANCGTKTQWFVAESPVPGISLFKMVNWAFGPCIKAFQHCRPVIGIDGTHLSGRYKGKLLTACVYDAEGRLVPLAFSLVHQETNDTWVNFMKFVRATVVGSRKVCVISDRHPSILRVFKEPDLGWNVDAGEAVHRQNQPYKFNKAVQKLDNRNHEACEWLMSVGSDDPAHPNYEVWSQAHDGGNRWGLMTTNGPESLNNVFREARLLPLTAIVEVTFYKCVKYFSERHKHAEKAVQQNLINAPVIAQLLEKRRLKGNKHRVISFRQQRKYEVVTPSWIDGNNRRKGGRKHTVSIDEANAVCTCLKPQLTGIPCSHVLAACGKASIDSNQFVSNFYRASVLQQTWSYELNAFGNPDEWPEINNPTLIPDPALYLVRKGRRKTLRIRNEMDAVPTTRNSYTCKKCGQEGHSRRTCNTPMSEQGKLT